MSPNRNNTPLLTIEFFRGRNDSFKMANEYLEFLCSSPQITTQVHTPTHAHAHMHKQITINVLSLILIQTITTKLVFTYSFDLTVVEKNKILVHFKLCSLCVAITIKSFQRSAR